MKPVVASAAYLLISHGSRDPRPQAAMYRLAGLVRERLERSHLQNPPDTDRQQRVQGRNRFNPKYLGPGYTEQAKLPDQRQISQQTSLLTKPCPQAVESGLSEVPDSEIPDSEIIVETACLELAALPLSEQIYEMGCRLVAVGVEELKLLPMFLMAGVHVMEDIPAEIAAARKRLGGAIRLTSCPHLGSHPKIAMVLAKRLESVPTEGSLLVAHGSRRPKGNRKIQVLARNLETTVAYWSVPPDIETQAIELMQQGCQGLAILPYFLFAGGITDAIAHRTEELAERFPKVKFRLLPTLGATSEVADLVVDLAENV
ncbi:MAG: sirohydrochlorin chelatase [Phormidesmis sp.]